jgi:hypothetical protein
MPKKSVRLKWTTSAILDRGLDALGAETHRLAELAESDRPTCKACGRTDPGLNDVQGKQLADYLRATVKIAEEAREAAKAANGQGNLAEQIAAALKEDPQLLAQVRSLVQLQAGRPS